MRSPAADRRRPTLWDGAVALLVAAAAVALFWVLRPAPGNFLTARVVLDGVLVAEIDLGALDAPQTLDLPDAPWPMTIQAEHGRICVLESACPGRDCVHTGWAGRAGAQIICLPNRLVISLSGTDGDGGFDAVTG